MSASTLMCALFLHDFILALIIVYSVCIFKIVQKKKLKKKLESMFNKPKG